MGTKGTVPLVYRGLLVRKVTEEYVEYREYTLDGKLLFNEKGDEITDYIYKSNTIFAEIRKEGSSEAVYYHHTDHLGTTEVITDSNGTVVWEAKYEAFGSVLNQNGLNSLTTIMVGIFIADAEVQVLGATYDFASQYKIMKEENIIGNDHYNHAMANSRAAQRGKFGKVTAQILSFIREATDVIRKGDSDKDIREDNIANRYGRNIKPGESPEEHNSIFDTRQGGQRADLSNIASNESPKSVPAFFKSFFTRDVYVEKKETNEETTK